MNASVFQIAVLRTTNRQNLQIVASRLHVLPADLRPDQAFIFETPIAHAKPSLERRKCYGHWLCNKPLAVASGRYHAVPKRRKCTKAH